MNHTKTFLVFLLMIPFSLADDSQTYTSCGGDNQGIIGCFGDQEIFFMGSAKQTVIYCGDGLCNGLEACGSCPSDCGSCPTGDFGPGHGGVTSPESLRVDRMVEFPFIIGDKVEDVVFNVGGPSLVNELTTYSVRLVPTLNGVVVNLDEPPILRILNGANQKVFEGSMGTEFGSGYFFKKEDRFLSDGLYKVFVTVRYAGRSKVLTENFVVAYSKDRLSVIKVGEVAPEVSCRLEVSNEGVVEQDFAVRYYLVSSADALFGSGLQARSFVAKLSPGGLNGTRCSMSDVGGRLCSNFGDIIRFDVGSGFIGMSGFWCKAETCRGWRSPCPPWGDPSSINMNCREVCYGGIRSEASDLLNVRGLGVKPVEELPVKLTFWDFWLSGGRAFSASSPLFGSVIRTVLLFSFLFLIMVGGKHLRKKGLSVLDADRIVYVKRGGRR